MEDLFARLSVGGFFFNKVDLNDAYCQLEIDYESSKIAVVNTHRGLYRYTRLAFAIASALAIFQIEIDKILRSQPGTSYF